MLITVLGLALASEPCEPVSNSELSPLFEQSIQALRDHDRAFFADMMNQSMVKLGCLSEPVTPENAAQVHRMIGLKAIIERTGPDVPEEALYSFAAARSAEPSRLRIFPDGLIQEAYADAGDVDADLFVLLPKPASGTIMLNGEPTLRRSVALPVLFQQLDTKGNVLQTKVLKGGESPVLESVRSSIRFGVNVPILIAGAAAGVAAGATYLIAAENERSLLGAPDFATAKRKQGPTNGLYATSYALTGVGVGLGITAVVVGTFGKKHED